MSQFDDWSGFVAFMLMFSAMMMAVYFLRERHDDKDER